MNTATTPEVDTASRQGFPSTRWSLLRAAGAGRADALETLAVRYRAAIYAWFRADGRSPADAADLTQEFFLRYVLDPKRRGGVLPPAHTLRVRYRSFLKACLRNFARNHTRAVRAKKRGGGHPILSIEPERLGGDVAASDLPAERALDREWARALVRQVFARLERELDDRARAVLRATVAGEPGPLTARRLQITEASLAQIRHRARARAQRILCEEAGRGVECARDLRAEIQELAHAIEAPEWLRPRV